MSSDNLADELWSLAVLLHEARMKSAWGSDVPAPYRTPSRKGYTHNPRADFDMALDEARAVLAAGYGR